MKIKIAYAKSNNEVIVRIFEIDPNETVSTLKNKIMGDSHIPTKQQVLFFAGSRLDDHRKLIDYNIIADGLVIQLMTKAQLEKSGGPLEKKSITDKKPENYTVIIQTIAGQRTKLECQASDTILTLKKKYQAATGIPVEEQTFLSQGKALGDTGLLDNYKQILNGSQNITMNRARKLIDDSKTKVSGDPPPQKSEEAKPNKEKIPLSSEIGFWFAGKHAKKSIVGGTALGTGLGYLTLHENLGLLSLAVGAGAGFFITLIVEGLIKCAIPRSQWKTMQEQERQSSVVGSQT